MQSDNTICKVFKGTLFHTDLLHHFKQLFLSQELFDGLNKVLITFGIVGDDFAHFRDYVERVFSVNLSEKKVLDLTELKAHESSSWLEHSKGLLKGFASTRYVSQAKRNGIGIESIVLKWKLLSIGTYEFNFLLGQSHMIGSLLSFIEHTLVDI
jgi:hypothetical protein